MLSRIEIKEELELFIEWPTDDHGSVSATSTALFAHHVQKKATEKLRAELERVTSELEQYKRDAERWAWYRLGFVDPEQLDKDVDDSMRSDALSAQPDHGAKLEMVKPELPREVIRAVFLRNGFTIKQGQTDLKQCVYDAAYELISVAKQQAEVE